MRTLNYKETYRKLLTPEIVSYLAQIHEQKGQQNLFIEAHKDALTELLEIAKIQSTEASNRIEGIITTDDRLKKIVRNKTAPRNRNEREIAGYRDVLATIHENYDFIPVRPNMILQLHRDLYKFNNPGFGGNYKNSDNIIAEEMPDGKVRISVFNTGSNIAEEDLENIWVKFYKVDKARTREYGGNGIGLSIVKAIMEQHNEKYGVENHLAGVEFWFELSKNDI